VLQKLEVFLPETVSTEYRHDGQTNRRTSCDGIVRAMHGIAR